LFPLAGIPLLNYYYIIEKVEELKPGRIIILYINKRFENHFRYLLQTYMVCINAIKDAWIEDDLVVVNGDNLLDLI